MVTVPRPRVSIGIATYLRPRGLSKLLTSISALTDLGSADAYADIRVFVVDNDEHQSAKRLVEQFRDTGILRLEYLLEPRRGIPFARNCFVKDALEHSDWLAFVDDDETVDPDWIKQLLLTAKAYQADVVTGPVFPEFIEPPPQWALQGRFFDRRRMSTGRLLQYVATNNTLVNVRVFRVVQPWFDERMKLMGGSDTHFFMRVAAAGFKMVWSDTAIAREYYAPSRVNRRWLYRRMYRMGNTTWYMRRDIWSLPWALFFTLGSIARSFFLRGLVPGIESLIPSKNSTWKRIEAMRWFCYSAGQVTALFGIWFSEYKETHGD